MKILVLYRPNSEHGRVTEEFIRDYQAMHGTGKIEVVNVDSREGSAAATLYDVMQYPAVLALKDDGQILRAWEGEALPLMDELAAYAYS